MLLDEVDHEVEGGRLPERGVAVVGGGELVEGDVLAGRAQRLDEHDRLPERYETVLAAVDDEERRQPAAFADVGHQYGAVRQLGVVENVHAADQLAFWAVGAVVVHDRRLLVHPREVRGAVVVDHRVDLRYGRVRRLVREVRVVTGQRRQYSRVPTGRVAPQR